MSTLSEILTQYREGSRGLPDYHELQQIASDQPLRAAAQQAAKFMRVFIERKTYLADWPDHVLSQLETALAQPATAQSEQVKPVVRYCALSAQPTEPAQPDAGKMVPALPSEAHETSDRKMLFELMRDLTTGFIRCERCGDQEELNTSDMYYALRDYLATAQPTEAIAQPAQEQGIFCPEALNDLFNEIDTFPELNMNNYDENEVRALNYWGVRVYMAKQEVLASEISPEPAQRDSMDAVKERLADMEAERNVWHAGYVEAAKAWDTAKAELSAMTAECDELKSNYAFLETSLRYMQDVRDKWEEAAFRNIKLADHLIDERDKWKQAYNDAIAEVRKLAEELGTLKGERDALADEVARHCGMLKSVAWDLENGFIRCIRCGDQEQLSTTDMAYALRDYFAAIAVQERPTLLCQRCGVDRLKEKCGGALSDCPIKGTAQGEKP